MMQEVVASRELVSALADGQLRGKEFAQTVEWIGMAEDAHQTWQVYHLVGDLLRSDAPAFSARDRAFVDRLKCSLLQQVPRASGVFAADLLADYAMPIVSASMSPSGQRAANDTRFRWKLLAGFSSLIAVSVIGWHVAGGWSDQRGLAQLAWVSVQTSTPEVAVWQAGSGGEPQVMIRDPQLDALLAAHKQFGGMSALQMPAGFFRNATFEGSTR